MTYDRKGWDDGFPFSPSPFKSRFQTGAMRPGTAELSRAKINDDQIPDGHALNFATLRSLPAQPETRHAPTIEPLAASNRPFAQRPVARQSGLRLLPLESFVWGSRANPPQPRTRPDHTLIWVTTGTMQLDFPRQHHRLRPDAVRYIPAGTAFAALPQAGTAGHALLIAPTLVHDVEPAFPQHALSGCAGETGPALLATLKELAIETAGGASGQALHYLLGVLALRLSRLEPARQGASTAAPLPGGTERPLVDRFLALAATQLGSGRTIADLADQLETSTAALDHACQTARGKRAIDLIHALRLEHAVTMLRSGQHSSAQIAKELGYSSHAHFTRAFVAATGRPPEAFRNQPL